MAPWHRCVTLRGARDGTGTLCSAPPLQAVPATLWLYVPDVPLPGPMSLTPRGDGGRASPRGIPHPHAGGSLALLDIFISVHTYTHGSQGCFILGFSAVSLQGPVRGGGHAHTSQGAQGQTQLRRAPSPSL